MVRIPYINEAENPALTELVARLSSGRRGKLLNLYRLFCTARRSRLPGLNSSMQ